MKQRRKNILLGAGLILVMLLSIVAYSRYTQRQIYHESTQNLLSTYGQVSKTFTMFVQRNWNILEIWSEDLAQLARDRPQAFIVGLGVGSGEVGLFHIPV